MRQRWPDQINVRGLATITEAISCPSATLFSFSEVAAHRPAMGILIGNIRTWNRAEQQLSLC